MKKIFIVLIWLLGLGFVGSCIYFVGGISATSPPIKTYEYSGTTSQFASNIKAFVTRTPDIFYKIDDTIGNSENGYAENMTIKDSTNGKKIEYGLRYEKIGDDKKRPKTKISLFSIFGEDYKTGGYTMKGPGITPLLKTFDDSFLGRLRKQQHMNIVPLKPGFFDFNIY
jgi:hypothetical protein